MIHHGERSCVCEKTVLRFSCRRQVIPARGAGLVGRTPVTIAPSITVSVRTRSPGSRCSWRAHSGWASAAASPVLSRIG